MKKGKDYYFYLAKKIIERFEINVFPNQLAEKLDNWNWRWEQEQKKKKAKIIYEKSKELLK